MRKRAIAKWAQEQDRIDAITDELRTEIGEEHWHALIQFNTYTAGALDLKIIFFRTPSGKPAVAFESIKK